MARAHPCLRLLRSTFPYQHPSTERAIPELCNTHMRAPLQAWNTETTKVTPTSLTVVPLLWCRPLVLHRRRSVMFVHEETKSVYRKEMTIMTKTAISRNPSQVSGESSHVDAVRDPPPSTQLCPLLSVTMNVHRHTSPVVSLSLEFFDIPSF